MKTSPCRRTCVSAVACFALLLVVAWLPGCMRQYTSPQFDPQDADFKGVASYLRDAAVVRVVFVHGMCTHSEEDWIDDTWNPAIQRSLNAVIGTTESKSHALAPESEYSIVRRSYAIGTKQLDARFVLWSESTAAAKRRLQFDAPPPDGEFRWRRARLNGSIKTKLVNDCLSDPVIYAGESGPGLREMMKTALCEAVDLT